MIISRYFTIIYIEIQTKGQKLDRRDGVRDWKVMYRENATKLFARACLSLCLETLFSAPNIPILKFNRNASPLLFILHIVNTIRNLTFTFISQHLKTNTEKNFSSFSLQLLRKYLNF